MSDRNWTRRVVRALVALVLCAAIGLIVYPVFTKAKQGSRSSVRSHLKIIHLGIELYTEDNDGCLPPAGRWMDSVMPFVGDESTLKMKSAAARYKDKVGPAFFAPLGGLRLAEIQRPESVPLLFLASTNEWNAHGDLSKLAPVTEDRKYYIVLFANGEVEGRKPVWPNGPITIVIDPSPDEGGAKE